MSLCEFVTNAAGMVIVELVLRGYHVYKQCVLEKDLLFYMRVESS